jgi:hypothetical protein
LCRLFFTPKLFNTYNEVKDHQEHFKHFSTLQLKDVPEWERMIEAWEKDYSQSNSYTIMKLSGSLLQT